MSIKAVLFDFDGTLTEPGSLDFAVIREAIGCPKELPILEFIDGISSRSRQEETRRILDRFEMEAAAQSRPNSGAEVLVQSLISRGMAVGINSRNSLRSIERALENFERIRASDFVVIISRDNPVRPKPSPDGIQAAAKRMGLSVEQVLVVGDFIFDIEAGRKAGARTVFLTNRRPCPSFQQMADYTIDRLEELHKIVDFFSPLSLGKLPNDLLNQFLQELGPGESSLLIGPKVGEDVAAVRLEGEDVLVLKSDPVTLATDAIGHYAVVVNVNDVVTCGATPRWLLASLLFPPGSSAADIHKVMVDLQQVARSHGLILCGGHTEVTDAVRRPIVVGQVAGTVSRTRLIDKRKMKEGDRILLTKRLAVEGTCIIAREFPERLTELGLSSREIEKCRQFLSDPGISVVKEAQIASAFGGVTGMHDVTEGGLATALEELSAAGQHRLRIRLDRIPVFDETMKICQLLQIQPLGLIGSGSLLISCEPDCITSLMQAITEAGISVTCIGEALESGVGVEGITSGGRETVAWPHFDVDEITRLFQLTIDN